jgi:hypothetical protein
MSQISKIGVSYLIYTGSSSIYYAKNGRTGKVDYTGSNLGTVVNNAIAATPNGGIIRFTPGSYSLDARIDLDIAGIIIEGVGRAATTITAAGSFSATDPAFYVTEDNCHIESMTIDMSDEGDNCIELYGANSCFFRDLYLENVTQDGIYMSAAAERNSNRIIDVSVPGPGRYGINIGENIGHSWIERTVISDTTTSTKVTDAGIYVNSSLGQNIITHSVIWGCQIGIHVSGSAYRFQILNNSLTDNYIGIQIDGTNGDIQINDNLFWYTGRAKTGVTHSNSDIYFSADQNQYNISMVGNVGNGQSTAAHLLYTPYDRINGILLGNSAQGYSGSDYETGSQTNLIMGHNR